MSLLERISPAAREGWMQHALALAQRAAAEDEVPVGAVIVRDEKIIGEGWNRPIRDHDPTAHAEIMAMRAAGQALGNYRLSECVLYVTLEPCLMCAGAMVHARLDGLVFGASDPKAGAVSSKFQVLTDNGLNHQVPWQGDVLGGQCGDLLRAFFRERRQAAGKS